ncbi:hypothetical protein AAIH16_30475, partial [Pseudomonas aeruginosa]
GRRPNAFNVDLSIRLLIANPLSRRSARAAGRLRICGIDGPSWLRDIQREDEYLLMTGPYRRYSISCSGLRAEAVPKIGSRHLVRVLPDLSGI